MERRRLLRMAGGLTAALAAPRFVWAQAYTATSISKAAQDARRDVGRLGRRADDLLRRTVAGGFQPGGAAVRRFRAEQVSLARALAAVFNGRVAEDDWLLIVPTPELDLVLQMRPLVIRIAPTPKEVEAALEEPLAQVEPLAGDTAEDMLHTIVLETLGLERRVALFEVMRNDFAVQAALKDTAAAVRTRHYGVAAFELQRLMRAMVRPSGVAAIAENLGESAERRLYKALIVRFVPFVGWSYFVALLLATIYQNRDTNAALLR
jgi:hypothetical protein